MLKSKLISILYYSLEMYRTEDMEKIDINLENIKNTAASEYITHNEPTRDENIKVYTAIKQYVIRKKRVVYGGFAQNLLIKQKNPKEMFYKEIKGAYFNWPVVADIEFVVSDETRAVFAFILEVVVVFTSNVE